MCSKTNALGVRKTLIIIWIIAWFLVINFFSIKAFYNNYQWNKFYENKNFSWAIDDFKKSNNYIWLYNIWNSNYRLWEQEKDDNKKIAFWEKSLKNYKDSMKINYTKGAEENYNFVKKKLEELKKRIKQEQEKKKKEEEGKQNKNSPVIPFHKGDKDKKKWETSEQDWKKQDSKENSWDKKDWKNSQKKDSKSWKQWKKSSEEEKWEKSKNWESKENKSWKNWKQWEKFDKKSNSQQGALAPWKEKQWDNLSKYQEQVLKQYEEQLKKQQKQSAWEFNKVYEEQNSPIDDFVNLFWNDPFFDNSLLNRRNEKKDW